MQGWIVFAVWGFAVLVALVLLGFTGYEVSWKVRRVRSDLDRLNSDVTELGVLAGQLQASVAGMQAAVARVQTSARTGN